ncbi:MAG: nuclease-related domain-containing protein [Woeseiaceae bacterium]|nr:nuclease-related domain-containing protein [Woeseiaceae bacterium]
MNGAIPLQTLLLILLAVAALAGLWFWNRKRKGGSRFQQMLSAISFARADGLIIPNGDEGEIQIDHLLLTSQGLLVLHIKDVQGIVFGSDKMQDWAVIAEDRRFTFSNPQPALYDRIAAVRQIVKDVPVSGRLLFLDGAEFTKGVPDLVATIDELTSEFGESDKAAAERKVDAFKPYWEEIVKRSR